MFLQMIGRFGVRFLWNKMNKFEKIQNYFLQKNFNIRNLDDDDFFSFSNLKILFELFNNDDFLEFKNFVDLGSGDGRVVFLASLFFNSTGIEKNKELYDISLFNQKQLSIECEFLNADYLNMNLEKYDLAFLNPDKPFYDTEKNLFKSDIFYLINNTLFSPRFMTLVKEYSFGFEKYGLYKINKNL